MLKSRGGGMHHSFFFPGTEDFQFSGLILNFCTVKGKLTCSLSVKIEKFFLGCY